jgi:OOP family OmpA-OmpF porin
LVSRGIAEERLIPQGRGEADPVVMCNDTLKPDLIQCLAPNRRVEIDAFTVLQTTN